MHPTQPTVLIIDDAEDDRLAFRVFLEPDFRVLEADLGYRGLAQLQHTRPDCVLLDYRLPDMDGLQVLQAIRQHYPTDCPAIVLLTGFADARLVVNALHAGAADFLEKSQVNALSLPHVVRNVIDKARLQRDLDQEKKWFSATLAGIDNGVIAIDAQGRVVVMNHCAAAMCGTTPTAALGRAVTAVLTMVDEQAGHNWRTAVAQLLQGAAPPAPGSAHAAQLQTPDGLPTPVEYTLNSVTSTAGRGAVLVIHDVSQRRRAEALVKEQQALLTQTVQARTAELLDARDAANAASQSKSVFLTTMSHEIRTPMNAIIGFTQMLLRSTHDVDQLDKLGKIADSANHLLGVINNILDISKIESGKVVLEQLEFDVEAVLANVSTMVIKRVQEKNLELVLDSPSGLGRVRGDPTRLGQALLNLLGNAVKFTERGSITLRVHVLEETAQQVLLRFEVQDTGVGVDPAQLGRLFQAFEQADNSTVRRFGGSGLGLVITRRLARLMGGDAGASSTPGVGSCFWMTARLTRLPSSKAAQVLPTLAGRRALVVDDRPDVCLVQSHLLKTIGLDCESALSGAQAIASVSQANQQGQAFDLLLIDLNMPDLNGLETLAALQKLDSQRHPVTWLVTASGDPDLFDIARRAGFDDVIIKPVIGESLRKALVNHQAAILGLSAPPKIVAPVLPTSEVENRLRRDHPNTRVLLVEDDIFNQEVALMQLEGLGWQPDVANNGQEALDLVRRHGYDLILMDMQMPVMGGLEATRLIRQLPKGKTIPILAMTANAFDESRDTCLQAGMNDFITKPVILEVFYDTLLRTLTPVAPLPLAAAGAAQASGD